MSFKMAISKKRSRTLEIFIAIKFLSTPPPKMHIGLGLGVYVTAFEKLPLRLINVFSKKETNTCTTYHVRILLTRVLLYTLPQLGAKSIL